MVLVTSKQLHSRSENICPSLTACVKRFQNVICVHIRPLMSQFILIFLINRCFVSFIVEVVANIFFNLLQIPSETPYQHFAQ